MIALIDYGAGNLTSVIKGLTAVGADVRVATAPAQIRAASGVVIPGVGHFAATAALGDEWRDVIRRAIAARLPVLGICLGLHWLFAGSDEADGQPGLGLLPGRCYRLGEPGVKVPHVGWNTLEVARERSMLLSGLTSGVYAYYTHSFAAPIGPHTTATTTHGSSFAAAVEQDNVFGVQFHPEKSGRTGLRVLANFVGLTREAR
jgi:glutamine amidotransferase